MSLNPVHKGKLGEVEFCIWLNNNLGIEDAERNYNQAKGGADIIIYDFIFEVKRREMLDFGNWWYQVIVAQRRHKTEDLIPIVAFRQNRKAWKFLIPASLIPGIKKGYLVADSRVFLEFAKGIVR